MLNAIDDDLKRRVLTCWASETPRLIYSSRVSAHKWLRLAPERTAVLIRLTYEDPVSVITGTPIHNASQVVVQPPLGKTIKSNINQRILIQMISSGMSTRQPCDSSNIEILSKHTPCKKFLEYQDRPDYLFLTQGVSWVHYEASWPKYVEFHQKTYDYD